MRPPGCLGRVQYFFLIAISSTALLMALPGFVLGRASDLPKARLALMVAVTTGIVAPSRAAG